MRHNLIACLVAMIFCAVATIASAQYDDAAMRRGVAERVSRAHNIVLDWQNATLSQLIDAEGRINTAARIKTNHGLSFNWKENSLSALLDAEGRLNTAARIRRNHKLEFDWQKNSLSALLDTEGRLNAAQRVNSNYGQKVDWKSYTLSQLLTMESNLRASVTPRQPAQSTAGAGSLAGRASRPARAAGAKVYLNVGDTTWITEVMKNGELVKLQDGSLWQVAPLDRIDTALWLATTDIVVIEGDDPTYPYRLINKDDDETADALLLAQ